MYKRIHKRVELHGRSSQEEELTEGACTRREISIVETTYGEGLG